MQPDRPWFELLLFRGPAGVDRVVVTLSQVDGEGYDALLTETAMEPLSLGAPDMGSVQGSIRVLDMDGNGRADVVIELTGAMARSLADQDLSLLVFHGRWRLPSPWFSIRFDLYRGESRIASGVPVSAQPFDALGAQVPPRRITLVPQ